MPIVGFYVKSISADRKDVPKGRIDINSTPTISWVKKSTVGLTKKESSLEIGFEFTTDYKPDVGNIKMSGNIMYVGKDIEDGLNAWKQTKKLPQRIEIEVKNFLFRKCLCIGIDLAEDMGLPPPLFFPRIVPKEKKEESLTYIG